MKLPIFLAALAFVLVTGFTGCADNASDPNTDDQNQNENNNNNNDDDDDDDGNNDPNRIPPGSDKSLVRITHLYPFPYGREDNNETIDLRNFGAMNVSLVGWKVRDNDGAEWDLSPIGTLSRDEKAFYKCLTPAQMDNDGDTLYLIDNQGETIQTVAYDTVAQGQHIRP